MNMMIASSSAHHYSTTTDSRHIAVHVNHGLDFHGPWTQQVHPRLRLLLCFGLHTRPFSSLRKKSFMLLECWDLISLEAD